MYNSVFARGRSGSNSTGQRGRAGQGRQAGGRQQAGRAGGREALFIGLRKHTLKDMTFLVERSRGREGYGRREEGGPLKYINMSCDNWFGIKEDSGFTLCCVS